MSVLDDSVLDYEEAEESEVAISAAEEDKLLGDEVDTGVVHIKTEPSLTEEVLDVQLSDAEMAEFPRTDASFNDGVSSCGDGVSAAVTAGKASTTSAGVNQASVVSDSRSEQTTKQGDIAARVDRASCGAAPGPRHRAPRAASLANGSCRVRPGRAATRGLSRPASNSVRFNSNRGGRAGPSRASFTGQRFRFIPPQQHQRGGAHFTADLQQQADAVVNVLHALIGQQRHEPGATGARFPGAVSTGMMPPPHQQQWAPRGVRASCQPQIRPLNAGWRAATPPQQHQHQQGPWTSSKPSRFHAVQLPAPPPCVAVNGRAQWQASTRPAVFERPALRPPSAAVLKYDMYNNQRPYNTSAHQSSFTGINDTTWCRAPAPVHSVNTAAAPCETVRYGHGSFGLDSARPISYTHNGRVAGVEDDDVEADDRRWTSSVPTITRTVYQPPPKPQPQPQPPVTLDPVSQLCQEFIRNNRQSLYGGGGGGNARKREDRLRFEPPPGSRHRARPRSRSVSPWQHQQRRRRSASNSPPRRDKRDWSVDRHGNSHQTTGRCDNTASAESDELRQYRQEYERARHEQLRKREAAQRVRQLRRQLRAAQQDAGLCVDMDGDSAVLPRACSSGTEAGVSVSRGGNTRPTGVVSTVSCQQRQPHSPAVQAPAAAAAVVKSPSGGYVKAPRRKCLYRIRKDAKGQPIQKFELDPVTKEIIREVALVGAPSAGPACSMGLKRRVVLPS